MSRGLHVKYLLFLSDLNETLFFFDFFCEIYSDITFRENPSSGFRVVPRVRGTNGQTDTTKMIVAFQNIAKAPKNHIQPPVQWVPGLSRG
jgi:hypothetical protein